MDWKIVQKVDLREAAQSVTGLPYTLAVTGDKSAHTWEISVYNNGDEVELTEERAIASFFRADGATIAVEGKIKGNVCTVTLPSECYAIAGRMVGVFRLVITDVSTTTISAINFEVREGGDAGGSIIVPGSPIQDYNDLIAMIAELKDIKEKLEAPVQEMVDKWFEDHPDAVTHIQDGSVTEAKMAFNMVTEKNGGSVKKEAYGTKWNASLLNLYDDYKHMEDGTGLVNNITESRKTQATYQGPDIAGECIIVGCREVDDEITVPVQGYTVDSFTISGDIPEALKLTSVVVAYKASALPDDPTTDELYAAMYGSDRYTGVVTGIDRETGKVTVNYWVKYNVQTEGQVPGSEYDRVVINPVRKIWGQNINIFVRNPKRGVICEAGLFGNSSNKYGYDTVLFNAGAEFGYRTNKSSDNKTDGLFDKAFYDRSASNVSFYSENPSGSALHCKAAGDESTQIITSRNSSWGVDTYCVDTLGRATMDGAVIKMLDNTTASIGTITPKLCMTTVAGTTVTMSTPKMAGAMTTLILRHSITLKAPGTENTLRVMNSTGDGFTATNSITLKGGQRVEAVYYSGWWYLTVSKAVEA